MPGGTCGIVLDEGVLFRTNETAFVKTKRKLLEECDVWCILSLAGGVFSSAGAGVKTNLVFFTKGRPTEKIWYFDLSDLKVGKKTPLTQETLHQVQEREPDPPHLINPSVDRDLETICLKCLEKEPGRRYGSAQSFAEDLESWMAGKPIAARPVGRAERAWRWCRRNPVVAGLAAAVALLVVVTVVGLSISTIRTRKALTAEADQRRRAQQHYREAREAVDQMLTRVGQERLANIPGMEQTRRELLEDALVFYQRFLQEDSTSPEMRQEVGKAHIRVAEIYGKQGKQQEEEAAFGKAAAVFEELTAEFPEQPDHWRDLARSYEGSSWSSMEKPKEREQAHRHAIEIRERLVGQYPQEPLYRDDLAASYVLLSTLQDRDNRREESIATLGQAHKLQEQLVDSNPTNSAYRRHLADILVGLGVRLAGSSRYDQSEPLLRRGRDIRSGLSREFSKDFEYRHSLVDVSVFLGDVLAETGRYQDAMKTCMEALSLAEIDAKEFTGLPEGIAWVATIKGRNLGKLLVRLGRFAEAEKAYREALIIYGQFEADFTSGFLNEFSRVNQGETLVNLGQLLLKVGRLEEAKHTLDSAQASCEKAAKAFPN
jgi:tetratricopeptide (TPR) repeat protein